MEEEQVRKAVDIIRRGGLVAFPTDTVYGLGADALNPRAVRRVFKAKGRRADMPVPLLVADMAMVRQVAVGIPDTLDALARLFWPGPLTVVLLRAEAVPAIVAAGGNTVGVRIPAHPVPLRLAAELGGPIVGTSANQSGLPSPTTAAQVRAQLGEAVDLIIEGVCPGGAESTVVDLTHEPPRVVRAGAVPPERIEAALGLRLAR